MYMTIFSSRIITACGCLFVWVTARPRSPGRRLDLSPPLPSEREGGSSSSDYRQYDILGGWSGQFSLFTHLKAGVWPYPSSSRSTNKIRPSPKQHREGYWENWWYQGVLAAQAPISSPTGSGSWDRRTLSYRPSHCSQKAPLWSGIRKE